MDANDYDGKDRDFKCMEAWRHGGMEEGRISIVLMFRVLGLSSGFFVTLRLSSCFRGTSCKKLD
jgi:hypothetical protein